MKLTSQSLTHDAPIPDEYAFCRPDAETHATFAANKSPHLAWSDVPAGTRSFCVTCIDVDVPTVGDDVNQEGRSVPRDLPRTEFVHWSMVDVPADVRELAAGACSDGVSPGGKDTPPGPAGARQGRNDYTGWFAGDPDMGGTYLGYDGPAPPWNDELVHRYRFEVVALDVASLGLEEGFDLAALRGAIEGHELGRAALVGTYTLNPSLR